MKQHDNVPPRPADGQPRWEAWRLGGDGRSLLGTYDSRDEATQAAAWDFARLNRNPKQLTDLVTNLKGQGTSVEMLRLFYDMPSLQAFLEQDNGRDDDGGVEWLRYRMNESDEGSVYMLRRVVTGG